MDGSAASRATDSLNWVIKGSYPTSSLIISPSPAPRSAAVTCMMGPGCLMNENARRLPQTALRGSEIATEDDRSQQINSQLSGELVSTYKLICP